jgi:hypothetical protein
MSNLFDHRLTVHVFATLDGDNSGPAHGQLRRLWQACVHGLDIAEPAGAYPLDPPSHPTNAAGVIAVRRSAGEALREAWWINGPDLACLSLNLSRTGQPESDWPGLLDEWDTLTEGLDLDAAAGVAQVLTALVAGEPRAGGDPEPTAAIQAALPARVPMPDDWTRTAVTTLDSLTVWQLTSWTDGPLRRLVITAPAAQDERLGDWAWGTPQLAPLTLYLLNAAKLHYQVSVLANDRDGLRAQRRRTDDTLRRLRPILTSAGTASGAELHQAQQHLANLQADETGLLDALIAVKTMRRTVQIDAANLAAIAGAATGVAAEAGSPDVFGRDQQTAAALDQDLDDQAAYLGAATERARLFADVADRELSRRAQVDAAASRAQQERFTLVQTAIIGAVLMALTAIQAFGYQIPLPGPAKPAVVSTLGAAALWLSAIALQISKHEESGRDTTWRTLFVGGSFGAVVASLAWTVTSIMPGHPTWLTVGSATAGLALGIGAAMWYSARARAGYAGPPPDPGA